jgi:predicted secreted protein
MVTHAFGQRYDSPVPLALFVLGGALVVLMSFALVRRRAVAEGPARPEPDVVVPPRAGRAASAASVAVLALLVLAGLLGSQEVPENILPTVFWLVVWIVLPLSCGTLGDWTRAVNPYANLVRLVDRPGLRRTVLGRSQPLRYPTRLGWWPAVLLFFALACGELIFNLTATEPHVIGLGLAVYAVLTAFFGLLFGAEWLQHGEVFSVLFSTWGRLGFFRFGALGRRGFAGGLVVPFERSASRVFFVMLLLISVNLDGLLATPQWSRFERASAGVDVSSTARLRVITFVLLTVVICAVFGSFAYVAAQWGGHRTGFRDSLSGLLPSMLPIAFGYLVAHNAQYVLVNSQLLGPLIGNPVGSQSWPIHLPYPFNDSYEPNATFLPSAFYWYLGVAAIVAVHVIAVILAHRHLTDRAPVESKARASEYPWLVAMIAYTAFSLLLIAQPLVKEANSDGSAAPSSQSPISVQVAADWQAGSVEAPSLQ